MQTGDLRLARRYATELFNFAKAQNSLDQTARSLEEIVETLANSRDLNAVLHSPMLAPQKKSAILHGVFGANLSPAVERFLMLVVQKNDDLVLPQISSEFNRLVDVERGEADGEAVSAVPLTPEQIAALQSALQARFGVKVRLKTRVNENILGGLIVRVGDRLIDGSVANKLATLREELKRVKVT